MHERLSAGLDATMHDQSWLRCEPFRLKVQFFGPAYHTWALQRGTTSLSTAGTDLRIPQRAWNPAANPLAKSC